MEDSVSEYNNIC